jgi:methylenetetrahydrofolate dehydrogenase (NADP+)/methenyltetrahydrofolate cyclohydrolase
MKILDGKLVSEILLQDLKTQLEDLNCVPKIAILQVGDNLASSTYVKNKIRASKSCGIRSVLIKLNEDVKRKELLKLIKGLNQNDDFNGIIVQLPLPKHINPQEVINTIAPEKDIETFRPATPYGITKLLQHYNIETRGKHCVVIGRSNIVGKPISIMLGNDFSIGNCTVTLTHIETPKELLISQCQLADIIIVAVGQEGFLTGDMVKDGAIVIDVGINRNSEGKIVGDVDFENVSKKCSWITPVPGGVGPMTIAALMINTLKSCKLKSSSTI